MAKKPAIEATAVEQTPPVEPVETPQRRSPLAIVGIVAASLAIAGALFGGGVLVGVNLPGNQPSMGQFGERPDGFPPMPNGEGGPGPVMPGQTDDTDQTQP